MSFLRGLENADATYLTQTTETEFDRNDDEVEVPAWDAVLTIPVRYEDESSVTRSEFARFVAETPMVFVEPSRIPRDLSDAEPAIETDWPYVREEDRFEIHGTTYAVTAARTRTIDLAGPPDLIEVELEGI